MRASKAAAVVAGLALLLSSAFTLAQSFPSRTVRIVLFVNPGGIADRIARSVAQETSKQWQQPVVVENRPGGRGAVAAQQVLQAAADGYSILMTDDSFLTLNPLLEAKATYDAVNDLTPVIKLAEVVNGFFGSSTHPANTLQEFFAAAKSKPGTLNYGSYGVGSHSHIATEQLAFTSGAVLNHIPYKAPSETIPALLEGQIHISLLAVGTAGPHVRAGKLKPFAIIGSVRSPHMPDVPTLAEAGFAKAGVRTAWFGLSVRAGTPKSIVEKIAADVGRVLSSAEFREKYFNAFGLAASGLAGESFIAEIAKERASFAAVIKRLKLEPQ